MAKDMLPKHLWPMKPVTDTARSYTVTSACGAKLNIRCKCATSLCCTVESSCSVKGNTKPRKCMTLKRTPLLATDFNVFWQKVRAAACECDEQSAWGNASDA